MFKKVSSKNRPSKLAPIVVVMLPEALAIEAFAAAFERKAGLKFPRDSTVLLQKNN